METKKILIHFLQGRKLITKKLTSYVPRVGDEIRLSKERFYKVTYAVWAYDEDESSFERVNLEIEKIS